MDNAIEGLVMGHTPQYMNSMGINSSLMENYGELILELLKHLDSANCDENKYRKTAILVIQNGKTKIVKENNIKNHLNFIYYIFLKMKLALISVSDKTNLSTLTNHLFKMIIILFLLDL